MKQVSPIEIAKAVSKASLKTSRPSRRQIQSCNVHEQKGAGKKIGKVDIDEILEKLRSSSMRFKSPEDIERMIEEATNEGLKNLPEFVDGSVAGTVNGTMSSAIPSQIQDGVQAIINQTSGIACGSLLDIGNVMQDGTMQVANQIASGVVDTKGEIVEGIIGDTVEVLS